MAAPQTPTLVGSVEAAATLCFAQVVANGNSGAAETVNWNSGAKQKTTLTANCTFTFTAPPGVANLVLFLTQDGTGSRTATWPATVKWAGAAAPVLSTAAGATDIVSFIWDGTNYWGVASLNFA
jgi:hypothetical protein